MNSRLKRDRLGGVEVFLGMSLTRKIIHVDMDAFYASVEQRDFPELRGKPVVVGGRATGRGVVAAASYEARRYGVRSAMSSRQAAKLCPQAIFQYPRFDAYREVSAQIMEIFREYTDLVEPLSLDEAYLDVTENKKQMPFARDIAKEIKVKILERTQLTASAGVAPNKFLAKIASDFQKPNGLTIIPPERVEEFLLPLPVRKFPGVGPVTEERMARKGIFTTADLRRFSLEELRELFGKSGAWYFRVCRGEDDREVCSEWERKSLGAEDTFAADLIDPVEMMRELAKIAEKVSLRLKKRELAGRTVTLKVTFADFHKITRSKTLLERISDAADLLDVVSELFTHTDIATGRAVRLLGIQVSHFEEMFEETPPDELPYQLAFSFLDKQNSLDKGASQKDAFLEEESLSE